MSRSTTSEANKAILKRWREHPEHFARDVFGLDLWSLQREAAAAVRDHPRVAIKSGHKTGKSKFAAVTAYWFVICFPEARVIMTSASARQIKSILWREITTLYHAARFELGATLSRSPETGVRFEDGREIVGFSTNEPERMAGISGRNVLFIADEASGIPEEIFEAIEGNRAGGARVLMLGNPTKLSGEFYAAFHTKRQFYKTITVSSASTPNVTGKGKPRPGLATAEWIAEKRLEWGEKSALYEVRVDGNFPSQGSNAVIPLALLETALERYREWLENPVQPPSGLDVGVDPALFGEDASGLAMRRGWLAYPIETFKNHDGIQLANAVIASVKQLAMTHEKVKIKVDVIGIGRSCFDQLNHSDELKKLGWEIYPVAASEKATSENFGKLRSQLWFAVADWLKDGGMLPCDSLLEAELVAVEYGFDTQGKREVQKKEVIKKNIGRSPDRSDALALSILRREQPKLTALHELEQYSTGSRRM
ncbi:MAG: hypothetical protein RLZZ156_2035 [Deinococcota bacterium]|jgi:phage terminase large subunit